MKPISALKTVSIAALTLLLNGALGGVGGAIIHEDDRRPLPSVRPAIKSTVPAPPVMNTASRSDCDRAALEATLLKARYQMALLAGSEGIEKALDEGSALGERVKAVFGNSDLVESEYSQERGCVVTARLPVDLLQRMTVLASSR